MIPCNACGQPYHEASGHHHSDKVVLCGSCARDFCDWVRRQLSRRWGKMKFYDYAVPAGVKR